MEPLPSSPNEASKEKARWRTKQQIAEHFQCDQRTISNWMRRRILPFTKVRGLLRFDPEACDRAFNAFQTHSRFLEPAASRKEPAPSAMVPPPPPPSGATELHPEATILPCRVFETAEGVRHFLAELERSPEAAGDERFVMMVLRTRAKVQAGPPADFTR